MDKKWILSEAPFIPLRNLVVFPYTVVPLLVGRPKSIAAIEKALSSDKMIVVASQKNGFVEEPTPGDLFDVGVGVEII